MISISILLLIGVKLHAQQPSLNQTGYLTFPFSKYVIRSDWAMPIVWKYRPFESIEENENVIAPPDFDEDWNIWYEKMKAYQAFLRNNLNDTASLYLQMKFSGFSSIRLHFKRVMNDMRLRPGDNVIFNGQAKNNSGNTRFRISLIYIRIGQEMSHTILKSDNVDTLHIDSAWTSLHKELIIPSFDTTQMMVQPVVFFESIGKTAAETNIKDLTLSIPASQWNKAKYDALKQSFYPKSKAIDRQLYNRKEMQWIKRNFISGFAFIWDQDVWDADKKVFTIRKYCDRMKKEFGGLQSVLLWYSYPNLGIDHRNTWEFLNTVLGGINVVTKHYRREGNCFPDAEGKNNNDYKLENNSFGKEMIVHKTRVITPDFNVMPGVVTNGEFELFITSAAYHPADTVNFLAHWYGATCPDSIKSKPVVFVSLEDARAYARWAGMRLPTEWEWQIAGETNGENFNF